MNFSDILSKALEQLPTLSSPDNYINRELSWLEFNKRILHQTIREDVPLLERLRFLGITQSNLDEFIMVRLSSVMNRMELKPFTVDISGITPEDEYQQIYQTIIEMKKSQEEIFQALTKQLHSVDIKISRYMSLSKSDREQMDRIFMRDIFPLVTPISLDTTKDIPLLKSKQLCLVVGLSDDEHDNVNVVSLIPFPEELKRIYQVSGRYITLEEIVSANLNRIFVNKQVLFKGTVRFLREADIELQSDDDIFITDRMKQTLRQREQSVPIFMDVSSTIPKPIIKLLAKMFHLDKQHIFKWKTMLDYSCFIGGAIHDSMYEYDNFEPQYPEELIGARDMLSAIDEGDILLHHPYESFGPVVKFLEQAAHDSSVLAIKQTLYRVASADSPIVEALCQAAEKGKHVSILLEIKARFDEEKNLSLVDKLKQSGCNIIYGIENLKTHAKFSVIVRQTKKGLQTYCHVGTGNYNNKTSKIYTDLSLFTSNLKIGSDLLSIFNVLSGFSEPRDAINKILYAPYNIRSKFYEMVDREIQYAREGKQAVIILKMNSLSDKGIIRKLYQASESGVMVMLLVRGICSMKPINTNIQIRSLVGRYLEHSRIYYFHNNDNPKVFLSSADMLTRNLDRRVEIMVPVTSSETKSKLIWILTQHFQDTFNTYIMSKKGRYIKAQSELLDSINIHQEFMTQAIANYKYRRVPKMSFKAKK